MKKPEEYLLDGMTEEEYFDQSDARLSFSHYEELKEIVKQVQIDVIEEAVNECAKNAQTAYYSKGSLTEIDIDEQSILQVADKLKKELE